MNFKVVFKENNNSFNANFKQVQQITDGGYDKGYTEGYDKGYGVGNTEGYENGYSKGEEVGYGKGYEVGYGESYDVGFDKGFVDGKQAEYDRFWDSFQENGNRKNYSYAFSRGWNNETFKPKYPIQPTEDASYMFNYASLVDFDFVEKGIFIDVSKATSVAYIFRGAKGIKRIGVFDCYVSRKNINRPFYDSGIETIDEFVFYEDSVYVYTFANAKNLKNIICSGVIASNDLSFIDCTLLSKDSITSVINALSTTTSGLSVALSLTAVNKAFETNEGANNGSNSTEWTTLVNTKPNWTINLT